MWIFRLFVWVTSLRWGDRLGDRGYWLCILVYRNLRGLFAVGGVAADGVGAVYDGVHAVVEGVLVGSWGEGKVKFVDAGGCFAHCVNPAVPVCE